MHIWNKVLLTENSINKILRAEYTNKLNLVIAHDLLNFSYSKALTYKIHTYFRFHHFFA